MTSKSDLQQILAEAKLYDEHNPYYDETFIEAGVRMRRQGYATKSDISVAVFWKAINLSVPWVRDFLRCEDRKVRGLTAQAFREGLGDKERLVVLQDLPGFKSWGDRTGGAVPSTLLTCWDPNGFGVVDVRVRETLSEKLGYADTRLPLYFEILRELRAEAEALTGGKVQVREIEKGLFRWAGDKKRR